MNPRYERWRWQILSVAWLAYFGFYLVRRSFSAAKIELGKAEGMGWNDQEMAWVDGAYGVTYAFGNFVFGALGDRYGPRWVVTLGMCAAAIVAIGTGFSTSVVVIGTLLGVQGLCQSSGWSPLAKNVGEFFSMRERGRAIGLLCTSMPVGSFVGSALAGAAAAWLGWRYAFWLPAGCAFGIALLFFALNRNRPEDVGLPPIERYHGEPEAVIVADDQPEAEPEGSWVVVREVLASPMVWLIATSYFLLKPTRYLIMFWAPLYINRRLGTNPLDSSILGSMPELAGLISPFLGGWLSDRFFRARRMPLSIIAMFACAILWFCFSRLPAEPFALALGLFGIGFLVYIPETLLSGSAAVDFGTKKGASTASGFINGAGSLGAVVGMTIPGWLPGVVGPDVDIWNAIFAILGAGMILSACILIPQWNRLPFRRE